MAGRRRTVGRRGPDGRLRPVVPVERANQIRTTARARYAAAQDDAARLAAAMDYARSAAKAARIADAGAASAALAEATRALWAVGDAMTERLTQGRAA